MKNLKGFNELNEAGPGPHGPNDGNANAKELDKLLEELTAGAEEENGISPKADLLVVYINQYLSKEDAMSIMKNVYSRS